MATSFREEWNASVHISLPSCLPYAKWQLRHLVARSAGFFTVDRSIKAYLKPSSALQRLPVRQCRTHPLLSETVEEFEPVGAPCTHWGGVVIAGCCEEALFRVLSMVVVPQLNNAWEARGRPTPSRGGGGDGDGDRVGTNDRTAGPIGESGEREEIGYLLAKQRAEAGGTHEGTHRRRARSGREGPGHALPACLSAGVWPWPARRLRPNRIASHRGLVSCCGGVPFGGSRQEHVAVARADRLPVPKMLRSGRASRRPRQSCDRVTALPSSLSVLVRSNYSDGAKALPVHFAAPKLVQTTTATPPWRDAGSQACDFF